MQSTTRWCLNEGSMSSCTLRSEWVFHMGASHFTRSADAVYIYNLQGRIVL